MAILRKQLSSDCSLAGRRHSPLTGTKKQAAIPQTEGSKQGVKCNLMTGACRLPLSLVVAPANTHDIRLVADTLDALQTGRPGQKLRLCLDKGYEAGWLKTNLQNRRYKPHIRSRKEEYDASKSSDFKAHRWVVERTYSWMNCFRRILIRWGKKVENYEAILHFACGLIVWNKCLLG